jgi:hypothetical protein
VIAILHQLLKVVLEEQRERGKGRREVWCKVHETGSQDSLACTAVDWGKF